MKTILYLSLVATLGFMSCNKDETKTNQLTESKLVPETFKVDVPSSISSLNIAKGAAIEVSPVSGNELYKHLRNFVAVGESAADVVEQTLDAVAIFIKIDKELTVTLEWQRLVFRLLI